MRKILLGTLIVCFALPAIVHRASAGERWSEEKAAEWYDGLPWLAGCNFLPSNAINQLEMWQEDTFDPETIDRELGWAADLGFNSVRVYLHDLPWSEDKAGFLKRVDEYLAIADKHGISTMLVLFDGVWDPDPQSGPQRRPRPGVHNSGWVQNPGRVVLSDNDKQDELKPYVVDVIERFKDDKRVVMWDLFNEPDNPNSNSYGPLELKNKDEVAERLTRQTFKWAREVNPSQPLTVGLWRGPGWDKPEELNLVHRAALELSDVMSFHDYGSPDSMKSRIEQLKKYNRPLVCTEYMARAMGSTFQDVMPILKEEKVVAYNWGLVDGKSQTKYPWHTWQFPIIGQPEPWHHDIFHPDGTPYSEEEVELIKKLTSEPIPQP